MIFNHLTNADEHYAAPSCETLELGVANAILVDSVNSSSIADWTGDGTDIDL